MGLFQAFWTLLSGRLRLTGQACSAAATFSVEPDTTRVVTFTRRPFWYQGNGSGRLTLQTLIGHKDLTMVNPNARIAQPLLEPCRKHRVPGAASLKQPAQRGIGERSNQAWTRTRDAARPTARLASGAKPSAPMSWA